MVKGSSLHKGKWFQCSQVYIVLIFTMVNGSDHHNGECLKYSQV